MESFSLVVNRNECFGLLGPNGRILTFLCSPFISFSQFNAPFPAGAGKTTLISVLTGLYEPSSGSAKVAGYDLATQVNIVFLLSSPSFSPPPFSLYISLFEGYINVVIFSLLDVRHSSSSWCVSTV